VALCGLFEASISGAVSAASARPVIGIASTFDYDGRIHGIPSTSSRYDSAPVPPAQESANRTARTSFSFVDFAEFLAAKGTQLEFQFAKDVSNPNVTYLYQKVGAQCEHLKFGITENPATRYTAAELNGGRLRIIGQGERSEMLRLERQLHETLPIGPEERQLFYIQKQVEQGLKPPPY
jgi:hypothetical protein